MSHSLSTAALGISALALGFTLWQGWTLIEHNRLSVRPHVISTPYIEGPGARNGLYIVNLGLGPALLTNVSISFNGTAYDLSTDFWEEALAAIGIEPGCFSRSWLPMGAAILVDQEIALLAMRDVSVPLCLHESLKLLTEHRIEVAMEYGSLYGEQLSMTQGFELDSPRQDYARALRKLTDPR
ncbi:hypothetical protein ACMYUJ_14620 [Stutzerimonas zhaodongensis]|uniref:hypothetical protein n=1 Tax=Stutzerimonas zhaodongensis TaxID=1176257 RepID=UPI0039EE7E04